LTAQYNQIAQVNTYLALQKLCNSAVDPFSKLNIHCLHLNH